MRIVKFKLSDDVGEASKLGLVTGDTVHDLSGSFADIDNLLTEALVPVVPAPDAPTYDLKEITYLPPIAATARIFCVGLNYATHAVEAGRDLPARPSIFFRLHSAQVGHGTPVICPASSEQFDFEGELAVIIGRGGRHIPEVDAMSHVGGYTCFAENSARDWQRHAAQVTAGKNFDSSGAAGPCLVTCEDAPAPEEMVLTTRLNGEIMQQDSPANLVFSIAKLISYISAFAALRPGDVIVTGSPEGVGASRTPPIWMKPGDILEVEITGIGILRNTVAAE
ncbi:fumarylacetoacetate hydrolase family protein [Brucella anthropi]|uniref:Fumarylacetoacetate hydrolase family protein n=2 Tax=Brucella anthropi TaxID=529 RepID=A0A6I0DMM9_BRUAN|nr:fumarylacetoacetate hydrolase family protein [Brucella anthropi]